MLKCRKNNVSICGLSWILIELGKSQKNKKMRWFFVVAKFINEVLTIRLKNFSLGIFRWYYFLWSIIILAWPPIKKVFSLLFCPLQCFFCRRHSDCKIELMYEKLQRSVLVVYLFINLIYSDSSETLLRPVLDIHFCCAWKNFTSSFEFLMIDNYKQDHNNIVYWVHWS